ncbi:MAG: DUF3501 family protein [Candidatus Neomarinimicrobiota bacterium]
MERITQADLVDNTKYESIREEFRRDIMEHKAHRRVQVGPDISLTFEDRRTVIFQIQEMMRAEGLDTDEAIQDEIDVYNTLLPKGAELSATLFIEITDAALIKERLHQFLGLADGKSLWLAVGAEKSYGQFEAGRSKDDQISSVHYVRFPLSTAAREGLGDAGGPAKICIAHGDYRHETSLAPDVRAALAGDLPAT